MVVPLEDDRSEHVGSRFKRPWLKLMVDLGSVNYKNVSRVTAGIPRV